MESEKITESGRTESSTASYLPEYKDPRRGSYSENMERENAKGVQSSEEYERVNVVDVYDSIAQKFSKTRRVMWPSVEKFIGSVKPGSKIVEVGCGNGKNLLNWTNLDRHGCDVSPKMVEICHTRGLSRTIVANNYSLPYQDNEFDVVLSVAVIHHLCTEDRRVKAISELIRICKPGGQIYIQVWALTSTTEKSSKNRVPVIIPGDLSDSVVQDGKSRDCLVSWNNEKERYYHFYEKDELENSILSTFRDQVRIETSFYESGNWAVILIKNF